MYDDEIENTYTRGDYIADIRAENEAAKQRNAVSFKRRADYVSDEDSLTSYRKRQDERARRRQQAIAERRQEEARIIEQRHAPNVDTRIERKIAEHRKLWIDIHGHAIAHERKLFRAEISEAVGSLRADLTIEKAAERHEQGDVIDIPQFLQPRYNEAA